MSRKDSIRFNATIGNVLGEDESGTTITVPVGVAKTPRTNVTITAGYSLVVSRYYEIPAGVTVEIGADSDLEIL